MVSSVSDLETTGLDPGGLYAELGLDPITVIGGTLPVRSPIDGSEIARVSSHSLQEVDAAIARAQTAFLTWREVPAPKRGELVRLFGDELRRHKASLGRLITLETGKIL